MTIAPPPPPSEMPFLANSAARLPGEDWEAYRKRRATVRRVERIWLRGRTVWNSKEKGTARAKSVEVNK